MGIALRPRSLRVDRHIDAPAAVVWRLFTDVRQWPLWGPSVRRAVIDGGASEITAGVSGTVWSVAGVPARFSITDFQPDRRWAWRVAGVPATGHEVVPENGGCRAAFEVPWWAPGYLAVCEVALRRIERLAVGG